MAKIRHIVFNSMDPEKLAKSNMEVSPLSGAAIDAMLREIYASPDSVVTAARNALKFAQ
jgi:hypothetical protein